MTQFLRALSSVCQARPSAERDRPPRATIRREQEIESVCLCAKIVDRKIPYSTQWLIFFRACPQWRLSELIAHSVCRPATSKDNAPSQTLVWSATLPRCARELTANLVFCSWATLFGCKCRPANFMFNWSSVHLHSPLRERTEENLPLCAVRIHYCFLIA